MKRDKNQTGKKSVANFDTGVFEIEHIPPPPVRGANRETLAYYGKLKRTLEKLERGQACKIPANKKNATQKFLKKNHPNEKFSIYKVADDDSSLRLYRLKASASARHVQNGNV